MHFLLRKSTYGTSTTPTIFLTQVGRMRRFGIWGVVCGGFRTWKRGMFLSRYILVLIHVRGRVRFRVELKIFVRLEHVTKQLERRWVVGV